LDRHSNRLRSASIIHPNISESYSLNLFKWTNRPSRQKIIENMDVLVFLSDLPGSKNVTIPNRWIGWINDGYFYGTQIEKILSDDKSELIQYDFTHVFDHLKIEDDFWLKYLTYGLCVIDPSHKLSLSEKRFETNGRQRCCVWCGVRQTLNTKKIISTFEVWEAEQSYSAKSPPALEIVVVQ
jgi:hypothetical protein